MWNVSETRTNYGWFLQFIITIVCYLAFMVDEYFYAKCNKVTVLRTLAVVTIKISKKCRDHQTAAFDNQSW